MDNNLLSGEPDEPGGTVKALTVPITTLRKIPVEKPFRKVDFEEVKKRVLENKPVLREIIAGHGNKPVFEYVKESLARKWPINKARQSEFLDAFESEVSATLGREIAASAKRQLKKYYYASTADHHNPIGHPDFMGSHFIISALHASSGDPVLQHDIVLSCSNISFSNAMFPRGVEFHAMSQGRLVEHQLSFFSRSVRPSMVFKFRGYATQEINKAKKTLLAKVDEQLVDGAVAQDITNLIDIVYDRPELYACKYFTDQVTKTNFELWKQFYRASRKTYPSLITVEQEGLVKELLIHHHLSKQTVISRMLFDPVAGDLMHKHFEGLDSCYDRAKKNGTYLFWHVSPHRNYRVQMWKIGNELVADDGSYRVALAPHTLADALMKKEIIPASMLSLMLFSFYYGVKLLGGLSQVNYLTAMKTAYINMMRELDELQEIKNCQEIPTDIACCDFHIALLKGSDGSLVPATGLDLLLYGRHDTWEKLFDITRSITLSESLDPAMPGYYQFFPLHERDEYLSLMTARDALELVAQKIDAFAVIS